MNTQRLEHGEVGMFCLRSENMTLIPSALVRSWRQPSYHNDQTSETDRKSCRMGQSIYAETTRQPHVFECFASRQGHSVWGTQVVNVWLTNHLFVQQFIPSKALPLQLEGRDMEISWSKCRPVTHYFNGCGCLEPTKIIKHL